MGGLPHLLPPPQAHPVQRMGLRMAAVSLATTEGQSQTEPPSLVPLNHGRHGNDLTFSTLFASSSPTSRAYLLPIVDGTYWSTQQPLGHKHNQLEQISLSPPPGSMNGGGAVTQISLTQTRTIRRTLHPPASKEFH